MSGDLADGRARTEEAVRVSLRSDDSSGALVLAVIGEVDLLSAEQVGDAVSAALARRPRVLVIDLSAVTFLDSTGLSVLAQAHAAGGPDIAVRVVTTGEGLARRAITLTGLDQLLPVFTSRAAALAADRRR